MGLAQTGPFKRLDARLADAQRHFLAPVADFSDLLVVDVDEESMQALESQLGAWPYDRKIYAIAGDYLARQGARLVVYDILFSEPRTPDGDNAFARMLKTHGKAALAAVTVTSGEAHAALNRDVLEKAAWPVEGFERAGAPGALLPIPDFADAAPVGVITVEPDADGLLRSIPIAVRVQDRVLPSLAMLAHAYPRADELKFDPVEGRVRFGEESWPTDDAQNVRVHLPRNAGDLPWYPFYRVVLAALGAEGYELPESSIRGRTVFIGSTAAILGDYVQVPGHGRVPGLGMLALAFDAIKRGQVYQQASPAISFGVFALSAIPLLIFPRPVRRRLDIAIGLVALGFLIAGSLQWLLIGVWSIQISPLSIVSLSLVLLSTILIQRMLANAAIRRRLETSAAAAREAAAMKSRFIASMTHELRTPLTAILGYNRLLGDRGLSEAERDRHHGVIDRSANHLLGLINNMLDQSKIEAGQLTMDIRSVDIRALCDEAIELLRGLAEQKRLRIEARYEKSVPKLLLLDPLRIRQILINLLGNSLKFTQVGEVVLTAAWIGNRLRIEVQDSGPGIYPEVLAKLFSPFQQGSARVAAEHGGTGLGLSISRNLAELMGGTLTAESEPGHGATFTLEVPTSEGTEHAADVGRRQRRLEGLVLLAEDNPDNRNLFSLYLKSMGLTVDTAQNGAEAIIAVQDRAPDLVLMDVEMPEVDGLEAARTIRAAGYEGPILALTAHDDPASHVTVRESGCDDVLVKPISQENLYEAISTRLTGLRNPGP